MRSYWSLSLSSLLFLAGFAGVLQAQSIELQSPGARIATAGGYLFPINPGQPNQLAGTMGELRNSHFHGGLDIRTGNRIGVPVLATQSGYISRVSISAAGYGTALYVSHRDGRTSVYGHLDKLKGRIAAYAKREQYRLKSFEVDLSPNADEFPVAKGDTIALSGNTGSSNGPHLHFEIREGNYALNPLKFGFTEIKDHIPPSPQRVALRTLDVNSRINDRFGRFEFSLLRRSAGEFVLPFPILAHGIIGIELLADDRMDGSPGRCGINYIEVFADSQKVFSQVIEKIDLDETRGILALMDYKTLETRGKRFNKLYVDAGNRLEFYQTKNEGVIDVQDADRKIRISLKDEFGNESNARLTLRRNPLSEEMVLPSARPITIESELFENLLLVTSLACPATDDLTVYLDGHEALLPFRYKGANQRMYLIDLRKMRPDSVRTCAGSLVYYFKDVVPSKAGYTYYSSWADVRFPENALYDTLFLNVNHRVDSNREVFVVGQRTVPLHKNVRVTLKPVKMVNPAKDLAVYKIDGYRPEYVGGEWNNGKVRFMTRGLGVFTFLYDSIAPAITRIRLDRQSARFRIRDGLSGVNYYEATVDGAWLLMTYDYKSGILQSDRLDNTKLIKGDFVLKVVDRAGNERIFKQKIL